jgi:AcrR family transcriptional regulator
MSKSSEPIWARDEPGARRPRYTREQIAAAALAVADAEGIEAVSMRRVAAELGAGTMTIYHYVRTKGELLDLMDDAIMAEVLVPDGELAPGWRESLTQIATRSRDAFARHPWAMEGLRGSQGGPNSLKHFEQTLAAVASLDIALEQKLELVLIVDDYVFGYVLRASEAASELEHLEAHESHLLYMASLLETGAYPHTAAVFDGHDLTSGFELMVGAFRNPNRFYHGLERLMDGIEAWVASLSSTQPGQSPGNRLP